MDKALKPILNYLNKERGFNFSGNRPSMLGRRMGKRLAATKCADFPEYLRYLKKDPDELDRLVDVLTINVSRFFRDTLAFASYDLLDKKSHAPPESVFGSFDLVLCRNVLIYLNAEYQDIVFDKLHRSLTKIGYLVLGEAETPMGMSQRYFRRVNECCHLYPPG